MIRDLTRRHTKDVRQPMHLKHNYEGLKRALVQESGVRTRQHTDQECSWRGYLVPWTPVAKLETVPKYEFDHRACAGRNWEDHQRIPKAHLRLYVELNEGP